MSHRNLLPAPLAFVAVAEDYLGIREVGGDNRGPAVEFFQKLGEIQPGLPWCAAYVNACAEISCAILNIPSPLEAIDLEGYVQAYYLHAKARGWIRADGRPGVGDLFMVYHPSKERYAHIGIVAAVTHDGFLTLEGNSNEDGGRDGIGVFQNVRHFSDRIVFANPWEGS